MTLATEFFQAEIGELNAPARIDLSTMQWRDGLLVRATNWLGDTVMSFPGVYRLGELVPAGLPRLVLCPEKLRPLWAAVPWIDRVIGFTGRRLAPNVIKQLQALNPGVSVILPSSFGSAWDLWKAGLPNRIGREGRGRKLLLHHRLPAWRRVPGQDQYHQARHYLQIAAACGATAWNCDYPKLVLDTNETAEQKLVDLPEPLLVIAPAAAYGAAKQWPVEYFREVAESWCAASGGVVAVGAPGEESIAGQAVADLPQARNLAGKTSLGELMYILQRARGVLANDSGVMHLAAALGKDGVAVFGSTEPLATGPVGGRWHVHRQKLPCAPCLDRNCRRRDVPYECLRAVQPAAVIESLARFRV